MSSGIFYIGRFPAPFGGVTIKNDMLYRYLKQELDIKKFDTSILKKKPFIGYIKFVIFLLNNYRQRGIIGVSSRSLINIINIMSYIRMDLSKITIFVMGGQLHNMINERDIINLKKCKKIYVELDLMKKDLLKKGFENIEIFPNCRKKTIVDYENKTYLENNKLKLIFMSNICKEKGVDVIIDTCEVLDKNGVKYEIDFYGHIFTDIKEEFQNYLERNNNINYKGVFESSKYDVIKKLKEYDILLFPTQSKTEGIPGILVEAKIAQIPTIASKWESVNEIIDNYVDGILIDSNDELAYKIIELYNDRELIKKIQLNCKISAKRFYIENYIDNIVKNI